MRNMIRLSVWFAFVVLILPSCKKQDDENPFNQPISNENQTIDTLTVGSFGWLHQKVFKPTCANSGCHDGNFEPDFRTIESSYNTLVNQPIIKNNPQNQFSLRVIPGNANQSVLLERMINDIDGISGIMPLSVDSTSDWPIKKNEYINHIKNWINSGALNAYGQAPNQVSAPPISLGMAIKLSNSNNPLPREIGNAEVLIPSGTNQIEVYWSLTSSSLPISNILTDSLRISVFSNAFTPNFSFDFSLSPTTWSAPGLSGNQVSYTHRSVLNISTLVADVYFVRIKIKNSVSDSWTEIPNINSAQHIKNYYSFKIP